MITILGDGAWGTAVATVLAANNHDVTLWCHNPAVATSIEKSHINARYLPNFTLSAKITPTTSLSDALKNKIVFEAIPVQFMRKVLEQCKPYNTQDHKWVSLSKGIEAETLLFPTQIITDVLGQNTKVAALSGPSYAYDLAKQQPTGLVVASQDQTFTKELKTLLENNYVYPEISNDLLGVQLSGALKNIFALGTGILVGAGYGENTQTLMTMRGLKELEQLIEKIGAQKETLYGLAGVGDLILTCFGKQSRNYKVGFMIGQGKKLEAILKETGHVPEGVNTLKSIQQLGVKFDIKLPICAKINGIIFDNNPARTLATF